MAEPKYRRAHQKARAEWAPIVAAGDGWCSEVICLKESRHIDPDEEWHLAHTPDATAYLGPAHALCNLSEAGRHSKGRGSEARPTWTRRSQDGCPVCGRPIKWASSKTCSRDCASQWRAAHPVKRELRAECKRGHSMADAYEYPSGARECRTCKRELAKAWRDAHPESVRAHRAKWKAANA